MEVPKIVDHDQRRSAIGAAVCRIAAAEGLEAVSMRRVGVEAGVSSALVQYYFPDKAALLLFAITDCTAAAKKRSGERIRAVERGLRTETDSATITATMLRAMLVELLPLDEDRREFLLVHQAYFARSMHDPEVASLYRDDSQKLVEYLHTELTARQREGDVPAGLDPRGEAETLVALAIHLGTEMLLAVRTAESAVGLVDYHVRRILPGIEASPTTGPHLAGADLEA